MDRRFAVEDARDPDRVYEVCEPAEAAIEADELPRVEDEGGELDDADERTLEPKEYPVRDRPILDDGAGAVLPDRGKGVYAEIYGPEGSEALQVSHLPDGTVELFEVGDDADAQGVPGSDDTYANSPQSCEDDDYAVNGDEFAMSNSHPWRLNRSTIPGRNDPGRV